jgi:hypothetical protein
MEGKPGTGAGSVYSFRLWFDSRDPRQIWKAALVHAVDVWGQVELVDQSATSSSGGALIPSRKLQLLAPTGLVYSGYWLFERLVRGLRLLWPLALFTWIPGVSYLGRALWDGSVQEPARTRTHSTGPASGAC